MAQLSKKILDKEIEARLFEVFFRGISQLRNSVEAELFLTDFLSPTEKVMLAKRLGIALLLTKGESYAVISDTLKVSTTTVMLVNQWLKGGKGGYQKVLKRVLKDEQWEKLWHKLETFISEITLPRRGSNWSKARKEEWRKRRKREKQLDSL
jgi:uncharacterized protein YerC